MKNSRTLTSNEIILIQLGKLKQEHSDLDCTITTKSAEAFTDPLELQRLKKKKLMLKDKITEMKNKITPDIIA